MKAPEDKAPRFRLELPIPPNWQSIELLHRTIASCTEALLHDQRLCQTLAMVASELIENAVKYGDWSRVGGASIVISPRAEPGGEVIDIEVTNLIAGEAGYKAVHDTLAWIASFPSSREAYVARIKHLSEEIEPEQSRLGLVRVAYEGGCEIIATLASADVLRVTATIPCASLCASLP
jgi:hypothetical protein